MNWVFGITGISEGLVLRFKLREESATLVSALPMPVVNARRWVCETRVRFSRNTPSELPTFAPEYTGGPGSPVVVQGSSVEFPGEGSAPVVHLDFGEHGHLRVESALVSQRFLVLRGEGDPEHPTYYAGNATVPVDLFDPFRLRVVVD